MPARGLVLVVLLSCAPPAPAPESRLAESPAPASTAGCGALTELQCIDSGECTLVLVGEKARSEYVCRAAEEPCETGFRQKTDGAEACEEKEGCRFVPARCYCSPDVTCICGGGPPPYCAEAAAVDGFGEESR